MTSIIRTWISSVHRRSRASVSVPDEGRASSLRRVEVSRVRSNRSTSALITRSSGKMQRQARRIWRVRRRDSRDRDKGREPRGRGKDQMGARHPRCTRRRSTHSPRCSPLSGGETIGFPSAVQHCLSYGIRDGYEVVNVTVCRVYLPVRPRLVFAVFFTWFSTACVGSTVRCVVEPLCAVTHTTQARLHHWSSTPLVVTSRLLLFLMSF